MSIPIAEMTEQELKKEMAKDYPLIPMDEISDEARLLAVAWHENATDWIGDKHKLASDIMNYARRQLQKEIEAQDYWPKLSQVELELAEYIEKTKKLVDALREIITTGKDWGWDENFWATNIAKQALREYEGGK